MKKVFIGTVGNDSVYFDHQTKKALIVRNFRKINLSKTKTNQASIETGITILVGLLVLLINCCWVALKDKGVNSDSITTSLILFLLNVTGMLSVFLFYRLRFYPHKAKYELATKKEFEFAARHNPYYCRAMAGNMEKAFRKYQWLIILLIIDFLLFPSTMCLIMNMFVGVLILLLCAWVNGLYLNVLIAFNPFHYVEIIRLKKNYQIIFASYEKSEQELQQKNDFISKKDHPVVELLLDILELVFEMFK